METIIALIWNRRVPDERHWIEQGNEEAEAFVSRIRNCYKEGFVVQFYKGKML